MFYMRYLTSVLFLFLGILPLVSFGQEVHTIKAIGDLPFSNQFQVRVNGQVATVEKLEKFDVPIHYTRIAYGGDKPVTIEIEINNPIEYYSISPKRKQLKGLVKDHILSFSLDGPTYLLVKINRMEELFILVDKMQDYKSDTFTGSLTDIMDYQVDNTGKSIETAKLQKAIDDVSRMNGVLYFPAGIYKTGELKMRSNMSVILSEGALLLGSEDVKDYADKSLIRLDNVSNFRLLGYGVIDGSGWSGLRNNGGTGFHLLYASDCNDILIDGVMLRDPSFWNTRVYRSKNFHLKNIKIFNNRPYKNWTNTDGIDFDVPVDMDYDDPGQDLSIHVQKGYQHLNGYQTMGVFRFRNTYANGDIGRIDVQHQLLKAMTSQFLKLHNIPNLNKLIDIYEKDVTTNLSAGNVMFYVKEFLKLDESAISFETIPANYSGTKNGMSYVFIHVDEWLDYLNTWLNPYTKEITSADVDILYESNGQVVATSGTVQGPNKW